MSRTHSATILSRAAVPAVVALALAGCSSVESFLQGDKVDYKSQSVKTAPLEVPPDLTQLQRESRYAPQAGTITANSYQNAAPVAPATPGAAPVAASTAPAVAPAAIGDMRIERDGSQRWLVVPMAPETLWPLLRGFWQERGFNLTVDNPDTGVMETDWAENRAKVPQDILRRTIGRVFDGLYDTGERDRFRTRIERNGTGTEVYISHRGMQEVYTTEKREQTVWQARPSDPQLEAEFLSRLMLKLGPKEAATREAAAKPAATTVVAPARARAVTGQATTLQVDEGFDRAWRRVGLALDRSSFTVEDRDRAGGLYFVRYQDPKNASKSEPGFFAKLFSFGKTESVAPERYRIAVKADGSRTTVSVQNSQGAPETGEIAQRIVALLIDELK
jgi:outer membrane protein assembly factor BamC